VRLFLGKSEILFFKPPAGARAAFSHVAVPKYFSLNILAEFPKVLERASFELGQQKSHFRISMQTLVENPLMTIESFNRQFQIGEKEREAGKWEWEQEMGKTMFQVVNAHTRGPSLRDYQRRRVTGSRRLVGRYRGW
jgi:hypothetical protein